MKESEEGKRGGRRGQKKTRGKRKQGKWGPVKMCTVPLTDDNTLKNETTALANETSLRVCVHACACVRERRQKRRELCNIVC